MEFEWDEAKAESNLAKHGVSFELALEFEWESSLQRGDGRFDYGEPRAIAIGRDAAGRFYTIVFTLRGAVVRVISARRASRREIAEWQAVQEM